MAWVHGAFMPGQPDSQGDQHDPQAVWDGCIPTLYPGRGLWCWLQSVAGCCGRYRSVVASRWSSSPVGALWCDMVRSDKHILYSIEYRLCPEYWKDPDPSLISLCWRQRIPGHPPSAVTLLCTALPFRARHMHMQICCDVCFSSFERVAMDNDNWRWHVD